MSSDIPPAAPQSTLRSILFGLSAAGRYSSSLIRQPAVRLLHCAQSFVAEALGKGDSARRHVGRFVANHIVDGLAILALGAAVTSAVLASVDLSIAVEPNSRPWIYDLSLAYLAGWIFNLLVVLLPRRRQRRALYSALRGSFYMMANSGKDLVRDLEFIGMCPEREITNQHVELVCRANSYNADLTEMIAQRLTYSRDAFVSIVPHLTVIDSDLAVALQKVQQNFLHTAVGMTSSSTHQSDAQPSDMRKESVIHTLRSDGPPAASRHSFHGWTSLVWDYYTQTQRVRELLEPHFASKSTRPDESSLRAPERVFIFHNHVPNEPGYPFAEYPPTAYSEEVTPELRVKLETANGGMPAFFGSMRSQPSPPRPGSQV
jgi:hypothetical protein